MQEFVGSIPVPEPTSAIAEAIEEPEAKPKRRSRRKKADDAEEASPAPPQAANDENGEKPKRRRGRKAASEPVEAVAAAEQVARVDGEPQAGGGEDGQVAAPVAAPTPAALEPVGNDKSTEADGPPRRGWWQRTFGA